MTKPPKKLKRPRGRPKREMPELPGPTMREVWETIFANAKRPDPALQAKAKKPS